MAAYESLVEYYLHQHNHIDHYLELCLNDADAELIHELRLSIKKLRAFNLLAERLCLTDTEEHIHIKHSVKQLYKRAGQLRDTQVQIQLLLAFEAQTGIEYPEFSKWLRRREKKRIKRFGKKPKHAMPIATPIDVHLKIIDMLTKADDETIRNDAGIVLHGLFAKAQKLSKGEMNDRDLHGVRILSKQLRYIITIMQHSYPDFKFNDLSVDLLREIEEATGHWHDSLVKVESLGKCIGRLQSSDNITLAKYEKFLSASYSELHIAYSDACTLVRRELHSDRHEK